MITDEVIDKLETELRRKQELFRTASAIPPSPDTGHRIIERFQLRPFIFEDCERGWKLKRIPGNGSGDTILCEASKSEGELSAFGAMVQTKNVMQYTAIAGEFIIRIDLGEGQWTEFELSANSASVTVHAGSIHDILCVKKPKNGQAQMIWKPLTSGGE